MPHVTRSGLKVRSTSWGSVSTPVRASVSTITGAPQGNTPDGWVADQGGPVWWLGLGRGDLTETSADALPVVIRATSLVVDPLVSDPFRITEDLTHGAPRETPRWVLDPMLLRPDERFPGSAFMAPAPLRLPRSAFYRQWVCSALWYGLGMIVGQVGSYGMPVPGTMRVLHPGMVQPHRRTEDGSLVWRIGSDSSYLDTDPDGRFMVGDREYLTIPLRNPHSNLGPDGQTRGVFDLAPSAFALESRLDGYARGLFRSGQPSGYLKATQPGLTQEQADEIKAKWMAAHGGDQRSVAVLSSTTEFTPLTLSPVDAALAQVKRLSIADVAYAFGIAPEVLGVSMGNSATYSNLAQWFRAHRDFGLSPWVDAIGGTLSSLISGGGGASVNLDAFERPDLGQRLANYEKALAMGVYTLAEVRAMESLPPLETPPPQPPEPSEPPTDEEEPS